MKKHSPKRGRRREKRARFFGPERGLIGWGNVDGVDKLLCGHHLNSIIINNELRYPNKRRCSICLLLEEAM